MVSLVEPMREKRHRLPEAAYVGRKAVSFVVCEAARRPLLANPQVVDALVPLLSRSAAAEGCVVPVYCFMPDHVHVMVLGLRDDSRPKSAMERFKNAAGRWAEYDSTLGIRFQKDFYDQIVRRGKGYASHVRYVALNPVRAGLVTHIEAWPFTGAIGADLNETLLDAFWG
ncbi:MAG: transposase [Fimbriimonas sp.]